jgi:hypothetical protein
VAIKRTQRCALIGANSKMQGIASAQSERMVIGEACGGPELKARYRKERETLFHPACELGQNVSAVVGRDLSRSA